MSELWMPRVYNEEEQKEGIVEGSNVKGRGTDYAWQEFIVFQVMGNSYANHHQQCGYKIRLRIGVAGKILIADVERRISMSGSSFFFS